MQRSLTRRIGHNWRRLVPAIARTMHFIGARAYMCGTEAFSAERAHQLKGAAPAACFGQAGRALHGQRGEWRGAFWCDIDIGWHALHQPAQLLFQISHLDRTQRLAPP